MRRTIRMAGPVRAIAAAVVAAVSWLGSPASAQTIVRYDTVMGGFNILLFDDITPITVTNFLGYVERGDFDNNLIHRSASNFVIQGGGWTFDGSARVEPRDYPLVPQGEMIQNEPFLSNTRGTIAMAKLAAPEDGGPPNGGPDSATNQWFINLGNNSANLDNQNGGFTAFGVVLDDGMDVVDAIAALPTFSFLSPWNQGPMRSYSSTDFNNFEPVDGDNVVLIHSIRTVTPGDLDYDGDVDLDDFDILAANYGMASGARYGDGDITLDDRIDLDDFSVMALHFSGAADALAAQLPEPGVGAMMLPWFGLAMRRTRGRSTAPIAARPFDRL